jgi:hypothetical protein
MSEDFLDVTNTAEWDATDETTDLRTLPDGAKFLVINGGWRGRIEVDGGVKYVVVEETGKRVPITGEEGYIIEVLSDIPQLHTAEKLTPELTDALDCMIKGGHVTDSDIEDFCYENNLSQGEVFHYIAVMMAPEECKRCKHVDMFSSMPPCTACCRAHTKDYFEEV